VLPVPVKVDEEVAAAKFRKDLAWLSDDYAIGRGLLIVNQEPMFCIIRVPATRADGSEDDYYLRLGAEYYDKWPPTAQFVTPETWKLAMSGSRWLPTIQCQGIDWFALHSPYDGNQNGKPITIPQLLCFTFSAEYYMVSHSPREESVWRQGHHTLTATLTRVTEVLQQPHYRGPSGETL
jgi:hypothetical protein